MPDLDSKLFGLILTGGKSSRMGQDKGLIHYHGLSQREYLFNLLSKFCKRVYTSCKTKDQVQPNLNPITDQYNIESPLNGILSAFDTGPEAAWLTVPVDMPLIDEQTIRYLIANRNTKKIATCFFDSDGKNPEPLFTLWEPQAYMLLKAFSDSGKISPRDFIKHNSINILSIPNPTVLTNINTVDELNKFKASHFS